VLPHVGPKRGEKWRARRESPRAGSIALRTMGRPVGPLGGGETHWDTAYRERGAEGVSWFQPAAAVSLDLIRRLDVPRNSAIIDIGGGASLLVDALLVQGFTDVTVLDISGVALQTLRQRLGSDPAVSLIHADLLTWVPERRFSLWHDRAVFHFLVDEGARTTYVDKISATLRPGGSVVIGTFAPDGPEYCSGLPVARYSGDDLAEALGDGFEVLECVQEQHLTPAAVPQPFTWLAARRR
jgi:SAM-dependent methyltransferase